MFLMNKRVRSLSPSLPYEKKKTLAPSRLPPEKTPLGVKSMTANHWMEVERRGRSRRRRVALNRTRSSLSKYFVFPHFVCVTKQMSSLPSSLVRYPLEHGMRVLLRLPYLPSNSMPSPFAVLAKGPAAYPLVRSSRDRKSKGESLRLSLLFLISEPAIEFQVELISPGPIVNRPSPPACLLLGSVGVAFHTEALYRSLQSALGIFFPFLFKYLFSFSSLSLFKEIPSAPLSR